MTRFDVCLQLVLGSEGGYSNHRADKGGATNHGITQAVYDEWRIQCGLGRQPVSGISGKEIEAIYLSRYWKLGRCEFLPKPLDYVHFDGCVNHGPRQAAKFLQRALQVVDDGAIGPKTLQAVGEAYAAGQIPTIIDSILFQREGFYEHLARKDATQAVFLNGWKNRIADVRKDAFA